MEPVYNSVSQITTECNKLIELGKECEYLDIRSMVQRLIPTLTDLQEYFNTHPRDTRGIEERKSKVEEIAIRTEYFIAHRLKEFVERNNLRDEAKELYAKCRDRLITISKNDDTSKEEILFWTGSARWALNFYARSLHILFEKTEKDIEKMKEIEEYNNKEEL